MENITIITICFAIQNGIRLASRANNTSIGTRNTSNNTNNTYVILFFYIYLLIRFAKPEPDRLYCMQSRRSETSVQKKCTFSTDDQVGKIIIMNQVLLSERGKAIILSSGTQNGQLGPRIK